MNEEIVSVTLAPRHILEKAKSLVASNQCEAALELLEANKTEVEVNEFAGEISMRINKPRFRSPTSYNYYKKHGHRMMVKHSKKLRN